MDHHVLAVIGLTGICLDLLGGMYLAYDLLGGQHGPLRLLTRMVTYSVVFGAGFWAGLGPVFGLAAGIATGVTVAIELHRTGSRNDHYPLHWELVFSAIRGFAFGAGLYSTAGLRYGLAFGALLTLGQASAYLRGARPGIDYSSARRPRVTGRQFKAAVIRSVGYIVTALICSALVQAVEHPWLFALRLGLVTGIVTTLGTAVNPLIEYYADHLPGRQLGVFGVCLVFSGFLLQTVPYWVTILNIPVE